MADLSPDHEQEIQEFEAATNERPWTKWIKIAAALIIGLIILVFAARWVYHELAQRSDKVPAVTAPTQKLSPPSSSSAQTTKSPATNPQNPANKPPVAGSQVPNTGPGSTLAIFLGASFIAVGLHRAITTRRTDR